MTVVTNGRRRAVRRVVTAVTGGALLAAAAGVALAGETWLADDVGVAPAVVPVAAATLTQVCPGPPRLATAAAGEDLGYDEFDPEGSGTESVLDVLALGREGQVPGALRLRAPIDGAAEDVPRTGAARLEQLTDVGRAVALEAEPSEDMVALATGTSTAVTQSGDLRGLTATPCQSPSVSTWLVGGSTAPGDSAQLVLSNAGETPASVTLRGWGATGALDLSGAGSVLVPPGGQQVVLLEALATDPRPALHVAASGGEVTALLQDSRLRGLVPAGTDVVMPSAAPAETVVVPGVLLGPGSGEGEDAPAVRVVNPGEEPVTAALELLGADGVEGVPGAEELVIDPGAVVDVSLAGLPEGAWTAVVSADRPVTGAAVVTAVGEPGEIDPQTPPVDRAWVPATAGLTAGVVAVPGEPVSSATFVVANPSGSAVDVELVPVLPDGTRGEPVARTVAARSSLSQDVAGLTEDPVAAVELRSPAAAVHATVALGTQAPDGALLSVVPLTQDPHAARAVRVAPAPAPLR